MAAGATAMRRPISRVRSVTETSMMFMMPTPPTTREMAATTSSREPSIREAEAIVLVISDRSRRSKSRPVGREMVPLAKQPLISARASGICSARRP